MRRLIFSSLAMLFLLMPLSVSASSEDESSGGGDDYVQVRMSGSLWETLIDNGVNPTLWKDVYRYNKENNPSFSRIRSADRIPRGFVIYIPVDWDVKPSPSKPVSRGRPTIQDTVSFLDGIAFAQIDAGGRRHVNEIIQRFCLPTGIDNSRDKTVLTRYLAGDLKDLYRRMGRDFKYRDHSYYVPLFLLSDNMKALDERMDACLNDPGSFVTRDSILPVDPLDIVHIAAEGDTYESLARLYTGSLESFPKRYPFRGSPSRHLQYMAQIIRQYNLNQRLWPGNKYYIPSWLPDGKYYDTTPEVKLTSRTKTRLKYSNGLEVSLEYHVTRKKAYWKKREKYYPPFERKLPDGSPAFPDMILWHRTGLEPEIEQILRARGQSHFSLRYIYRTGVTNYYIDENGDCFQIVDMDKNARDHAGAAFDYRCLWNGLTSVSDVSVGIEVEGWFLGDLSPLQLSTARKLQDMIRSTYIIPEERILDHRKVACRRGPEGRLERGRKADGLSRSDRLALGIQSVLDPDVLRGIVDPNLDDIQRRQADSLDYWYRVELDPDLVESARMTGWLIDSGQWQRPSPSQEGESFPSSN